MKLTKFYQKEYPRPQFVRNDYLILNGTWDFAFDDNNIGEKEAWFQFLPKEYDINVPFTYQTKSSGINFQSPHPIVWYHKTLRLNEEHLNNKRTLLHLEGSDYFSKVYVNGKFIDSHQGGYSRFTLDITDYVTIGENNLTIRVEDDYSCTKPRGKQRWMDTSYGCWYVDTTGIWKTIWCEFVSTSYLQNVKLTPILKDYQIDIDYTLNQVEENLSLQTIITLDEQIVADVTIKPNRTFFRNSIDLVSEAFFFQVHHWHHQAPVLYDIEFILYKDHVVIDRVGSYFGVRDISTDNNSLNINYSPSYLRMTLDQGYWEESHLTPPDDEAIILDIKRTLEMGFNGIRKHQKIEDERFLYFCDVLGVYVWEEMPSPYEFNDEMMTRFTSEWMEVVKQNYNHPCIITWVPFNESWGIQNVAKNVKQQKFTESIYYLTKAFDHTRPVVCNDGWEHTISDIITLHNYQGLGKDLINCYGDIEKILNNQYTKSLPPRHAFAKGYAYKGQPIMISEYAGIAFEKNKGDGWGYGKLAKDELDFINRLRDLTLTIKNFPFCCGYCVTQTTDVQHEVNGLLDANRNPKAPIEEIRKINLNNE